MSSHARVWTEFGALLRAFKELQGRAVEASGARVELAGVHVLSRLALLGPVRLTDLAGALGLDPSSVSRQVSAVERAGLVSREEDPSDRRATRLHLTPKGAQVVADVHDQRTRALARLTPDWTDAELDQLADLLARLNQDLAASRGALDAELENA